MQELMSSILEQAEEAQVDLAKMIDKSNKAAAKRAKASLLKIEKESKALRKQIQEFRNTNL
jgi:hypothetical protein